MNTGFDSFLAAPSNNQPVRGMTDLVWSNVFAFGIAIVLTPIVMPWRFFRQKLYPSGWREVALIEQK
jgi:hypothetical protein